MSYAEYTRALSSGIPQTHANDVAGLHSVIAGNINTAEAFDSLIVITLKHLLS